MKKTILLYFIPLLLLSCYHETDKKQKNEINYFDIKHYFEQEVIRLSKASPLIIKSVKVNDSLETKKIKIKDWKRELAIFSDADINRTSWSGLFHVTKLQNREIFTSDDEKVPVKEV